MVLRVLLGKMVSDCGTPIDPGRRFWAEEVLVTVSARTNSILAECLFTLPPFINGIECEIFTFLCETHQG
jgi:hypothetical protein